MIEIPPNTAELTPLQKRELLSRLLQAKASEPKKYPLSFAQQRLWFLDQLEPGGTLYNLPTAVRLTGELKVAALEATLGEIVRRHEVLRTTFRKVNGEPVQVVGEARQYKLEAVELSEVGEEEREAAAAELAKAEAETPFDLEHGPLLRVKLLRLGAEEHVVLLTMHHIVSDGWSTSILVREVAALYEAFSQGAESPLEELKIQYGDYAVWQREWLQGEVLEEQLWYWEKQLGGELPVLELPADRARPAVRSYRGAQQSLRIEEEVVEQLQELSGREGCTLFMSLLAAYQVLLCRYSGQEEVVVGTPIAGRNRAETEELIGFFVNMLALRTELSGGSGFREVLRRVKRVALEAYAHQDLPFEKLVEELQPERDLSRSPLFQAVFGLHNMARESLGLTGLRMSGLGTQANSSKFDLTLSMRELSDGLSGTLEYNTDLYEPETIERLVAHYQQLLRAVVAGTEQSIWELSLLSEAERRQLVEWNETSTAYEQDATIAELFERQVKRTPEAVAVVYEGTELSYRELNERANQRGHYLRRLGVGAEVLVGIMQERSLELIVSLLGVLKAGGAYLPLDPRDPLERLGLLLAEAQPAVLLTEEAHLEQVPAYWGQVVCVDSEDDWQQIAAQRSDNPSSAVGPENLAYVMYTSGTTGKPKGVMVTQRGVVRLVRGASYAEFGSEEVFLQYAPVSFDASTFEIWGSLLHGARLVLMRAGVASLGELAVVLRSAQVSTLWLTAGVFQQMVESEGETLAEVRQVLAGGDVLGVETVRRHLRERRAGRLINGYGPTESTTFACTYEMEEWEQELGRVPIGRPIANTRAYVVERRGGGQQLAAVGVVGELYLGGAGLGRGYLGQPELTAEKFVPDGLSGERGGRLYRTGDLVRYRSDGTLEFLGRRDQQVKVRGYRIELGEIEAALQGQGGVREAVVLAQGEGAEKRLVAYVVSEGGGALDWSELRQGLREQLPEYMVPGVYVGLEQLPLTSNGKLDRRALPAPEMMGSSEGEYLAPRTPVEEVLAGIFGVVLSVERVGVSDNFFELGGHSLLATQVISRVRESFGVELALRELFEEPTVAGLGQAVERELRGGGMQAAPPLRAVARTGELPLSFAQQRLWFLDQLEPGSAFYNVPFAVRLTGELAVGALEATFTEIVRRHEVLRTRFRVAGGEPVQVIDEARAVTLSLVDLSELAEGEREAEARRLATAEARTPFDLQQGPLLRVQLLRLGAEEHVVLLTLHHIISDGWSLGVLIREVAALYEAFSKGEASPLPELEVQYADYAVWQREWLQGEVLAEQLRYWEEQLGGELPVLELPVDHVRPAVQSHRGARQSFVVSAELSDALRNLSQSAGCTLFMSLLAAFEVLLCRYSGQEEVVVGTPIAGRTRRELEPLIGFFVNTLALRTDLRGNPRFRELLGRVREVTLGAYAHQEIPFEKLVEELQPERDLSRSPLFQVMFVLQNAPTGTLQLPGLKLSGLSSESGTAKFDLDISASERSGSLHFVCEYNTDLFEAETIERLLGHYERVLEQVSANVELRLWDVDLLAATQKQQLLVEWNETYKDYRRSTRCLHKLIEEQVGRTPSAIAVVHDGTELSYRELNERANQLAHQLRQLGVGPDVLVGICLERSLEMIVSLLAVLKAGGAYVPMDPGYPTERLSFMMADCDVAVLLTETRLEAQLPVLDGGKVLCLDRDWPQIAKQSRDNPTSAVGPENLAYVIYTSGSTGKPKGVMISHSSVANYLVWLSSQLEITSHDRVLQFASINFDTSAEEIYSSLIGGATLVLRTETMLDSIPMFLKKCAEWDVSVLDLPTAFWHELTAQLIKDDLNLPTCIRLLVLGGEKASADRLLLWKQKIGQRVRILNSYGPTETTIVATMSDRIERQEPAGNRLPEISIGRPVANVQTYVLDRFGRPVPQGVAGELHIGGSGVGRGYLNRADLTAEKFIPDPFGVNPGARLYRTGDLVRHRQNGELEFLGRIDHQVKVRGYRIELGEIEDALLEQPQVRDAVVIAREEGTGFKQLVAYVIGADGIEIDFGELQQALRQKLPAYMVPAVFVKLTALPLTPNGKLDRKALPMPVAGTEQGYVGPRTPLEELMAAVFGEVLGVERVGIADNFFELGGHSLLATRVISKVQEAFQVEIPLRRLFEEPTVAGMAQAIEAALGAGAKFKATPIRVVSRDQDLPLSFGQQRLWFLDQLEPGGTLYNLPTAVRLTGELKVAALEATLSEIVRRHEVLRTTFRKVNGEPVQVVGDARQYKLEAVELSELGEEEREAAAAELAKAEAETPFDLEHGPLLRVKLLRQGAEEHVVLLTMHHIVSDGWSTSILVREVAALYEAFSKGAESPLGELKIQYGDYAVWQREWLQGEVLEEQLRYWEKQLGGELPVLELPVDRARPAVRSYRGAQQSLRIEEEVVEQLQELSGREGCTLFMSLLAAYQVLLCRYSGQEEVVVGTSIAGRNRAETEDLIGFFVNMLALRTELSGGPGFREVLRRVKRVALEAYAHQDLPFEKLVEELQPERDLSRSPLFQVMFVLHNAPSASLQLPGLQVAGMGTGGGGTAKFDLILALTERGDELSGTVEYNTDLFESETIERLVEHYQQLLRAVVSGTEQSIWELSLLSEGERRQLVEWNETSTAYEQDATIAELFERQVERTPEAVAVVYEGTELSYRELNERANQRGHYLRRLGVGAEVLVGIMQERSLELIVSLLGVLKAGGAYLPLDPRDPLERLGLLLAEAQPAVLLTEEAHLEQVPAYWGQVVCVDSEDDWQQIAAQRSDNPSSAVGPENLAYVMYTSGTTGKPKGVMVTQRGVVRLVRGASYAEFGSEEVFLQYAPVSFDASTFEIWGSLLHGARLVLMRAGVASLGELAAVLRREQVSTLWLTAGVFQQMVESEGETLAEVRQVLAGGDVLGVETVRRHLRERRAGRLINGYGPTESTTFACTYEMEEWEQELGRVPIGRPIANTRAYVVERRGGGQQLAAVGVVGELYLGGAGLGRGYLGQPELTAEKFVPDGLSGERGGRLYRTGDLVRYRSDGTLEFLGRRDQQVKVRGYRIELGEIEAALQGQGGVREAVVLAQGEGAEKRLVAYVVSEGGGALDWSELRQGLREQLPEYMVPGVYVGLEQLPLTSNGKLDRRALPAPEMMGSSEGEYLAPRTPVEEVLAGIFGVVLGVERVGVADNFFELGGHSLLATQVISRVRESFGVELALRELFEEPTVVGLGQAVERELRGGGMQAAPPLRAVARTGELPLSFAQQRLWFLDQLEPGSAFYNVPFAVRLTGELAVGALEATLTEIVRRHEVLRTTFGRVNGEPVQVIDDARAVTLPVVDLSELAEGEREAEARRLAQAEARTPFDLQQGPLLRVQLLRLGAEEHVVLLTLHHIISDGWSLGVLIREVAALYEAFSKGEASPLPHLEVQYADYAVWQREWLQGEVLAEQLRYWEEQLGGELPVLELPLDHVRPAVRSYRGAQQSLWVEESVTAQLKALSRREGCTLFMSLLAAFEVLLCRYSGQEEVVVGTPIAGRTRRELEPLIGFFVNTLALRTDLSGGPGFREVLRRVKRVALEAYAHQEIPFEKLVEELQPERDLSRTPLFQVMFVLQNAPSGALQLPGLKLSGLGTESGTAKFDLTLSARESEQGLALGLEYNTDLFAEATIKRMLRQYETLLQSVVHDPEQEISRLALLTASEREEIVRAAQGAVGHYTTGATLPELFARRAAAAPEAIALVGENGALTYAELDRQANRLSQRLRKLGVGPESLVSICLERSEALVVAILGVLKAGGAYVPLDPASPAERLSFILEDTRSAVLITMQPLLERLAGQTATQLLLLDADQELLASESAAPPPLTSTADNLAYVIYTSGSTGKPKGTLITHYQVTRLFEATHSWFNFSERDVWTLFHSYAFDFSVWEIWGALLYGGKLVIVPYATSRSASAFYDLLQAERVTVLNQTPSAFKQLVAVTEDAGEDSELALRLVIFGGEALELQSLQPWFNRYGDTQPQLVNMYGITETTVHVTYRPLSAADLQSAPGSVIGSAIPDLQVYLLDQHLEPVPLGAPGELYVGGAGVARGYLNRPELTAERFVPDPFSATPGQRLYRSGDSARGLGGEDLAYLGRLDQQVKIRGHRIELGELEATLNQQVRHSVVVAKADATNFTRLVAYVVPRETDAVSVEELRRWLKRSLPDYMLPAQFVTLQSLPLTGNGKIDYKALPEPDSARPELATDYLAPQTPMEEVLAGIFAAVLSVERVGVADNFFELGGHSLLATQVISRVRESFGVELALRELFEEPTVVGLGQAVERELRGGGMQAAPPLRAVERTGEMPLSFAQQRLWFLDQLEPGSAFYNVPFAVRLTGELAVGALEATLTEIVRRHEVLRTTFERVNGEPVQVIEAARAVTLPLVDLSELAEGEREAEARRLATAEARTPFDLQQGPLLRVQLLRLGAEEHVVLLTLHHIISDGWSLGVLIREVAALYEAFAKGEASPLPELEVQYADYAVWQREWLQGEVLAEQLRYWEEQLGGELPVLELPVDHVRPAVQSHRGARQSFVVSAELSDALRNLSQSAGCTLFMSLLAAFEVLLCRYSGQEEVVVGTPIAGRTRRELEPLIGFFVNTLALRTNLSGGPDFREVLRRVKRVALEAYAHQEIPFEKLVEELQPERDLSRSPLFQVMFVLQNAPSGALQLPGLKLSGLGTESGTAKFDLLLNMSEQGRELVGTLEYNTDLYEAETIARMVAHFEVLLSGIAATPEQRISDLPLLREAERRQLVEEWNATSAAYEQEATIAELFERQVERTPAAVALIYDGTELSYRELNERANQLAHYLRSFGINLESRVGQYLERSADTMVAILATLKAGAAYVALDPSYPTERLSYMLADADVPVLLTQQSLLTTLPQHHAKVICLDTEWQEIAKQSSDNVISNASPQNLAYVIYTSGSTGKPKGVAMTHGALTNLLDWQLHVSPATSQTRTLQFASASFDVSFQEIFSTWCAGGTLVVLPEQTRRDATALWRFISENAVERLFMPYVALEQLAEAAKLDPDLPQSLREINTAGEQLKITPQIANLLCELEGCTLHNQYGPSETHVVTSHTMAGPIAEWPELPPIGRPIANTQAYILDRHLQLVPIGVVGELYVGGSSLARGYLNNSLLTAERFIPDCFGFTAGARLYRTGDLARYRRDGEIEFLGRSDHQIKIRGFRVELGEIETVLTEHPAVRVAVVMAKEMGLGDKRLVAYLLRDSDHELDVAALRDYVRGRLPEYMIPASFVILDQMPLTPSGKIDRRKLPAPDRDAAGQNYIAPRTPVEEKLTSIWSEVLGVERIGVQHNFFELGGHSLLATQVISRVRENLGVDLPLRQLFEQPTVAGLAEAIDKSRTSGVESQPPTIRAVPRESRRLKRSAAQPQ